jgi:tripartite-type tricarboxylate transporter receptor subunit TctC
MVVGFPPGGGNDIIARIVGAKMQDAWGQPVVIDNKPGAASIIAAEFVAKSAPDGHTLLVNATGGMTVNPVLYDKLPYDPLRDFVPISIVGSFPMVLAVHPSVPVNSVRDLIAYAKANPGKINYSSFGNNTLNHLYGEMFKAAAGINTLHVPYKGSAPGIADLMSGHVVLFFDGIPSALPHVKSGRVRALGVASSRRSPALPDVPAIAESLKGFEADSWFGLMMPAGTPRDIVIRFDGEVQKILATQEVRDRLLAVGGFVQAGGPDILAQRVKEDIAKWGKVARSANVKVD